MTVVYICKDRKGSVNDQYLGRSILMINTWVDQHLGDEAKIDKNLSIPIR